MADDLHDWQKEFKLKGDLTQLDVEKLEAALLKLPVRALTNTGMASRLKAAIEAGWVEAPETEVGDFNGEKRWFYNGQNIDEMHPGAVRWLGKQIDDAYTVITEIPKNL